MSSIQAAARITVPLPTPVTLIPILAPAPALELLRDASHPSSVELPIIP
jgi:hypothetical protein